MITVVCSQCRKKLKVNHELAGKKVRCPGCREIVAIGAANDDATAPPQLSPDAFSATPLTVAAEQHSDEAAGEDLEAGTRYHVGAEIARGGMGAILRAVDQDIQREVAVKFLLNTADARQQARFVEEAQITGQLEHPNIVPIHQLGVHEDGRCFFSMKMVKGRSLAEILKDENSDLTLGRLLTMFVNICNAMAYAHSRQVIHRDLKPANIMVGDFGEVYVMDWGLAKVLGKEESSAPSTHIQRKNSKEETKLPGTGPDSKSGDKVTTNRLTLGDLTQAGAIMGTPAYMPPEQAQGGNVDERADIYSLGAILYEIMTLSPPVGRGGDMMAILMRVVEGQIEPPQQRAPERAKAGWIAPELAAIAMQALSKDAKNRYQTVVALQRDIELYLEGRSVSAKHDSAWEMFKKLVKRNKGASIATAAALVVLAAVAGVFLKINYDARVLAENNNAAFLKEQKERQKQGRESIPTYVTAARLLIDKHDFAGAMRQVRTALEFDADHGEARFLRAQLLMIGQQFEPAQADLEAYRAQRPNDVLAKDLAQILPEAKAGDIGTQVELADAFSRHLAFALADGALESLGENAVQARKKILEIYRQRIDKAWPDRNWGNRLSMGKAGQFSLSIDKAEVIAELTPLAGMKLSLLYLNEAKQLRDLSPLKGMPLTSLSLPFCSQVHDLTPLKRLPLTTLYLNACSQVRDVALQPLAEFTSLQTLSLANTGVTEAGLKELAGLKSLQWLSLHTVPVTDAGLKELAGLTSLQSLELGYTRVTGAGLKELAGLTSLKYLGLYGALKVTDAGLKGLAELTSLQSLNLASTGVSDAGLKELAGLTSLRTLTLDNTRVTDAGLKELAGLTSLEYLSLRSTAVSDAGLKELAGLTSLQTLNLSNTKVTAAGVAELQKALPRCKIYR